MHAGAEHPRQPLCTPLVRFDCRRALHDLDGRYDQVKVVGDGRPTMSTPFLIGLLDAGQIECHTVGTHRRVKAAADALATEPRELEPARLDRTRRLMNDAIHAEAAEGAHCL